MQRHRGGGAQDPCTAASQRTSHIPGSNNLHFCILEIPMGEGGGILVILSKTTMTLTPEPPPVTKKANCISTFNISVSLCL